MIKGVTMSRTKLIGIIAGMVIIVFIVVLVAVLFRTNLLERNQEDSKGLVDNQLPSVEERQGNEGSGTQSKLDNRKGYSCLIPLGWNVSSAEEDKDIPLEQSKAVAISKDPYRGVYPLNYHANIAIYVYDSSDDLFAEGGFDLESINGFLSQKDELLENGEEIVERLDVQYRDTVLDGIKGKEYFTSSKTNKGNLFLESNCLIKVGNRIYSLSFHDLGSRAEANQNLAVFQEFCRGFKVKNK